MGSARESNQAGKADEAACGLADDYMWGFELKNEAERRELGLAAANGWGATEDIRHFTSHSLLRGVEEWDQMVSCATAMKEKATFNDPLAGQDLLTFLSRLVLPHAVNEWVADNEEVLRNQQQRTMPPPSQLSRRGKKRERQQAKDKESPYWAVAEAQSQPETRLDPEKPHRTDDAKRQGSSKSQKRKRWKLKKQLEKQRLAVRGDATMLMKASVWYQHDGDVFAPKRTQEPMSGLDVLRHGCSTQQVSANITPGVLPTNPPSPPPSRREPLAIPTTQAPADGDNPEQPQNETSPGASGDDEGALLPPSRTPKRTTASHFFTASNTPSPLKPKSPRPPRGTVSALPFPRLDAPRFGLIQEELADDPFRLLIAVTFLIRTPGKSAIPAFRSLVDRYPTPQALAEANADDIIAMIRHLGLSSVRAAAILRYARTWCERPPRPGVRYGVKNYPGPVGDDKADVRAAGGEELLLPCPNDDHDPPRSAAATAAWEIGHMTQGRYALDSWRIFCRDALLGRAEDWRGRGREGEFQPEWMRVLPEDKELRAYLRWLWMQEGWDWDPETGERGVLSEDVLRAVQEGRVEWDFTGELRITRS
ncbi:hypothetical protein DL766_008838 [Monosporascus sp. MC13-8B]|uniref:HhH-GPD domain-containing protein n=1 Tax=Monosporascus cannonballus TaxID=155416 RepID=A0ABY0GWT2_9PEZI|nr:hypothetical protein DL762_009643 [Monosporascus cannonballus]RYO80951.1 hypothetical protein DL763_008726 [Monosporascus cannonballus]RYP17738.1 hypothetical protein DL766_008838 [Monosporascus sp. MC13-8B]